MNHENHQHTAIPQLISPESARLHGIVPIKNDGGCLWVMSERPLTVQDEERLSMLLGIQIHGIPVESVQEYLSVYRRLLQTYCATDGLPKAISPASH